MPRSTLTAGRVDRLTLAVRELYMRRTAAQMARPPGLAAGDLLRLMRRNVVLGDIRGWFRADTPHVHYLAERGGMSLAEHDRLENWHRQLVARGLQVNSPEYDEALAELKRTAGELPDRDAAQR